METGATSTSSNLNSTEKAKDELTDALSQDYGLRRLLKASAIDSIDRNLESEDREVWKIPGAEEAEGSPSEEEDMRVLAGGDITINPPAKAPVPASQQQPTMSWSDRALKALLPLTLAAATGAGGLWLYQNWDNTSVVPNPPDMEQQFDVRFWNIDGEEIRIPVNPHINNASQTP